MRMMSGGRRLYNDTCEDAIRVSKDVCGSVHDDEDGCGVCNNIGSVNNDGVLKIGGDDNGEGEDDCNAGDRVRRLEGNEIDVLGKKRGMAWTVMVTM